MACERGGAGCARQQRADAWVAAQAARLQIGKAAVLRAIAAGLLPATIETLSPFAFVTEMSGRSTVPRDVGVIKALRQLRERTP